MHRFTRKWRKRQRVSDNSLSLFPSVCRSTVFPLGSPFWPGLLWLSWLTRPFGSRANYNTNGSFDVGLYQINDVNWDQWYACARLLLCAWLRLKHLCPFHSINSNSGKAPCNPSDNVHCAHMYNLFVIVCVCSLWILLYSDFWRVCIVVNSVDTLIVRAVQHTATMPINLHLLCTGCGDGAATRGSCGALAVPAGAATPSKLPRRVVFSPFLSVWSGRMRWTVFVISWKFPLWITALLCFNKQHFSSLSVQS